MRRQEELPGTGRPSIPIIDEVAFELQELNNDIRRLTMRKAELRDRLQARIIENSDLLEKDDRGCPVYVTYDEGIKRPYVVRSKTWIEIGKPKRVEDE